jgi:hypothetical protein
MKLEFGQTLIFLGLLIAAVGFYLRSGGRVPNFGHLPGDIAVKRDHFQFYFPVTTSLLLSGFLSLLFWLFRR